MTGQHTVVITGSSGLIGTRLINRAPPGFSLVGFDNHGPPEPPVEAECVPVDMTSERSVRRALQRLRYAYGDRIASVVHLAAYYDFSGQESDLYDRLTVGGTERLLRFLREDGFDVGQLVFSSTMLVHPPCEPGQKINEDWPLEPSWLYPQSKVKAERAIEEHRGGIPAVILRIAGVYNDGCHSIPLAHQIQRIYERRLTAHVFPGDTSRGQSFVHLDDVVDAIWLAVQKRAALPERLPLLIGEPETISYDELQRSLARLIHGEEDWETRRIPEPVAELGAWIQDHIPFGEEPFIKPWMIGHADDHYELDITRARKALGWEPRRTLRGTLAAMVSGLKADPERWYRENKLEKAGQKQPAESARN
jgi:nucleoside-diphosphate-sugar epimerase